MHIIGNCEKHIRGSGQSFKRTSAWAVRDAATESEYRTALQRLKRQSPLAAKYFDDLKPHNQVYQYAMTAEGIATHGFKTSQIVEGLNGVFVKARLDAPYRLNARILKWQGKELQIREKDMEKWIKEGHPITKYATDLFKVQVGPNDT